MSTQFETRFRQALSGGLRPEEAQALTGGQALSAEEKKIVLSELRPEHFASDTEKATVLAALGIAPNELQPAPEPSKVNQLIDKAKGELVKVAKDKLEEGYKLDVADFAIGEHAGIKLEIEGRIITSDDPSIQNDKQRRETSKAIEAEGKRAVWVDRGLAFYPRASIGASASAGPVTFGGSWAAGANIAASIMTPHALDWNAPVEVAKQSTVEFPINADKATLPAGSDFKLWGRGQISASMSVGVGKQLASAGGYATLSASASASVSRSRMMDLSVQGKFLGNNRVFISISEIDRSTKGTSAGVHVGVDATLKNQLPDLGGQLINKAAEAGAGAVEKQVEKYLQADFRASHTRSEQEKEITNYVIDLSQEAGRKAYNAIMGLDVSVADGIADKESKIDKPSGMRAVRRAELNEQVLSKDTAINMSVGPLSLLSFAAHSDATSQVLDTSEGKYLVERGKVTRSYSGLISDLFKGERSMSRELVEVQRPDQAWDYYFRGNYEIKGDKNTTKDDISQFVRLAKELDAIDPELLSKVLDPKFSGSFDDTATDRTVVVYVSKDGLDTARSTSPKQRAEVFGQMFENIFQPSKYESSFDLGNAIGGLFGAEKKKAWPKAPWLETDHAKHAKIIKLLEHRGTSHGPHGNNDQPGPTYFAITRRDYATDVQAYRAYKRLEKLLSESEGKDPKAQIELFVRNGKELGFNFEIALATLAKLAGPEQVMVEEMSIKTDDGQNIVLKREGAIQDPRIEINARLANPA